MPGGFDHARWSALYREHREVHGFRHQIPGMPPGRLLWRYTEGCATCAELREMVSR